MSTPEEPQSAADVTKGDIRHYVLEWHQRLKNGQYEEAEKYLSHALGLQRKFNYVEVRRR